MRATLTFTEDAFERISDTLFDHRTEHIAFGRAGVRRLPGRIDLLVGGVHVPDDEELDLQSPGGVRLSPGGVCRVMSWFHRAPALVDMHNHVSERPRFSRTDDSGARVQWRILQDFRPGAVLLQLVFGPDGSFQARWSDAARWPRWRRVEYVKVVGGNGIRILRPWDADPEAPRESRWAVDAHVRTRAILGDAALSAVAGLNVGVVGLGGNGSALASLLPFYFPNLTFVDPDIVEPSNLGRLFGASPKDVGAPKVEVARRAALRMRPDASIRVVRARAEEHEAVDALKGCDLVAACPDSDDVRYFLAELAARHMLALVELGTGVAMEGRRVVAMGSQVRFQWPGGPCLACLNLAPTAIELRETIRANAANGYLRGTSRTPAEVVTTNATAAALAMRNVLAYASGHLRRPVPSYLLYDETVPSVIDLTNAHPQRTDCPVCGDDSFAASGDELPEELRLPAAPTEPPEVEHADD